MEKELSGQISYQDWKLPISQAGDFDQLHRLITEYLAEWDKDELARMPDGLSSPELRGTDEIIERALLATRAEINAEVGTTGDPALKEMALTFSAATTRFRRLQAGGSRHLSPTGTR